jgi:hypothetical protein
MSEVTVTPADGPTVTDWAWLWGMSDWAIGTTSATTSNIIDFPIYPEDKDGISALGRMS